MKPTLKPSHRIMVAGVLALGAAVASSATAAADPAPDAPVEPAVPAPAPPPPPQGPMVPGIGAPLGPTGLSLLEQNGTPTGGPLGLPQGVDLNPNNLLAQNAAPGGPPAAAPPSLRAFNNGYLLPQNEKPAAPGQGTMVGVAPGEENADISGRDYLKQLHELYRNGNLKGSLLGQMPQQQLGEPLPGTAPLPGTNVPPGLAQYLPDPAAPVDPAAPPVPPAPAPPAP
ncbi:hypothetical protein [Mycolicibacterium neworleansense]|uniref:FHA domain-containing protein n=1 Tax=Mycolicibacterium neworleansense TaxID=146018 RepID=A0A0H5RIQ6_9MYCO|nr:hypothetical protein [Mycolicibacterium neworleansense]MCV7362201.1 hypothetical protein [Mycolicibacterium neworleansense]CRZ13392.1 hypothetical protein BN2156_00224 [Mycolicibacterium neworleansense]